MQEAICDQPQCTANNEDFEQCFDEPSEERLRFWQQAIIDYRSEI